GLGKLNTVGLLDDHPGVRRHSIRVAEKYFGKGESIGGGSLEEHVLAALVTNYDEDAQLRLQGAYTLGAWKGSHRDRAQRFLASMAGRHAAAPYLTAAVLSSVNADTLAGVLAAVLQKSSMAAPPPRPVQQLLATAAALDEGKHLPAALALVSKPREGKF